MSNNQQKLPFEQEEKIKYPNSAKELRALYKASVDVWLVWLEPIRSEIPLYKKLYTPKQVQIIIAHLGEP